MDNDLELMQRFKTGDTGALEAFVRRFQKDVFNFAMRMSKNRQEAEDLAQETFIRAIGSAKKYYPGAKPTTWLYKIASNLAIDRSRRKLFRKEITESDIHEDAHGDRPRHEAADEKTVLSDEQLQRNENADRIRKVILSLPVRQRAALVLLVYEDKSYSEIAGVLGISIGAVETLIFRARSEIREKLKIIK